MFERLQQSDATKNIPVVAISANAMESDIKKTLEMGFSQYLTKPIILSEFLEMLSRHLGPANSPTQKVKTNIDQTLLDKHSS